MELIRKVITQDIDALKQIVAQNKLFEPELLNDMLSDFLFNEASSDVWFTLLENNVPVAFAYCIAEKLTQGTYNILAVAVHKNLQGKGVGKKLISHIEQYLYEQKARIIIIESSGNDEYSAAKTFYYKIGYKQVATINEFWAEGEDKVIFLKKLK
jgi:ribosomal protein S18 acetylase RimI-like enzyme